MNLDSFIDVAIVGCGRIGSEWDALRDVDAPSLTHAGAFTSNPMSKLVAVCDVDIAKAERAALRWGCSHAYSNLEQLFERESIDLLVVATSSAARLSVISTALAAGVRYFVIEKPLAATLSESTELVAMLEAYGARALVNFSRRWDPAMQVLRENVAAGGLGTVQRLVALYGKGMANNGSHLIDLVSYVCNARPVRTRVLRSPLSVTESDWSSGSDPTLDAQVVFVDPAGKEFHLDLLGTNHTAFTCFELKMIGCTAICDITLGGRQITMTALADDPHFAGYRIPASALPVPARYLEAMDAMAAEAIKLAQGHCRVIRCDVYSALETARTVETIRCSVEKEGSWIVIE